MPVIPFFPDFDFRSNFRSINSQGLELLGSTCQSQIAASAPLSTGQHLPQQYAQQHPQTPQTRYDASQYTYYPQSQPVSPFGTLQQRPVSAPQPGGHDGYMLPSLQSSSQEASSGYQLSSQPAIQSQPLYQPVSTTAMYQPALVTPVVPSSGASNYLPYTTSNPGHGHSLSLGSSQSVYGQKSCNQRTPPQPLSAGRVLSTLGAIPPSGLAFFGLTPEQQAFFQQRRLPPPPPPQPRVYNFENSTQVTIAETLAATKENKEKRAGSSSPRSQGRPSDEAIQITGQS
ncbi:hypothetical protein Dda_4331 [Drechslerella dactyloides]|uniref:Uncharacterized protein n=1 Tax=Drechslerella dactyloides TaxID=74499 RepID=A0AAD6NJ63_DREDA|nr:hypothetical protein Dda_4331 [Drechslerella dactyloides]